MLGTNISWFLVAVLGIAFGIPSIRNRRPSVGLGVAMAVSILGATWVAYSAIEMPFDVRTAMAALFLIVFCVHPQGRLRFAWHRLDAVIIGMVVVGIASDFWRQGIDASTPFRVYGEWAIPYFAGRFTSMRRNAIGVLAPWFTIVALIVCLSALIEAVTGVNAWEVVFAPMDDLVQRSSEQRYDLLYRASGPTRHPIFLGVVLILLVPWAVALTQFRESRAHRIVGWVGLGSILIGIVATVSRGPLLGIAVASIVALAITYPKTRIWLGSATLVSIVSVILFWNSVVGIADATQSLTTRGRLITVEDEAEVFSGTRNRIFVWKIYGPLVLRGGPLGFGTKAVSSFPPNIPGLPASARTRKILGIVDNSFLLVGLRYGWIGLSLFVLLLGGSIATALQLRRSAGLILYPDGPAFLTAMASILIGVCLEMLTVFFSYDFGFWVLFHCGVVAGLASLKIDMVRGIER